MRQSLSLRDSRARLVSALCQHIPIRKGLRRRDTQPPASPPPSPSEADQAADKPLRRVPLPAPFRRPETEAGRSQPQPQSAAALAGKHFSRRPRLQRPLQGEHRRDRIRRSCSQSSLYRQPLLDLDRTRPDAFNSSITRSAMRQQVFDESSGTRASLFVFVFVQTISIPRPRPTLTRITSCSAIV